MKLLRMTPGKGDVLLAEGDPEVAEDEERLVREFRRQLELGMWAAVPARGSRRAPRGDHGPRLHRGPCGGRAGDLLPEGGRRLMPRRYVRNTARERRAERRARELLRSTAGDQALEIYERFGLLSVQNDRYGYLIYPQRPIVAYDAESGELLSEYCVRFRDGSDPEAGERLPDADDVLAKWMALRADEHELIGTANVHPLGRQLDPAMVRRDLWQVRAFQGEAEERPD